MKKGLDSFGVQFQGLISLRYDDYLCLMSFIVIIIALEHLLSSFSLATGFTQLDSNSLSSAKRHVQLLMRKNGKIASRAKV
jgi:hypothetical protein